MAPFRSAKGFLQIGGAVLLIVGILGFFLIGPTADSSIFGSAWSFTTIENWIHMVLGIVALGAAMMLKQEGQMKMLAKLLGLVALVVGVAGFFTSVGDILDIVIAIWAFWAVMGKGASSAPAPMAPTPPAPM